MNTRTSKLIFPAILFLFACLIAFGENGPTPKVVVGSSGISDGSVTNAKLAEPISVANGGTSKTTAAAGLAALGGASLNGSSTVEFNALSYLTTTKREHSISVGSIVPTGTATYVFTIISNAPVSAITEVCGYESGKAVHYYRDISTFYVTAGSSMTLAAKSVPDDIGVGTITVTWMWKEVNRIQVVITNNSDSTLYDVSVAISFVSTRASQLMRVN